MNRSFVGCAVGVCLFLATAAPAATITGTVKTSTGNNPSGAVTIKASNGASTTTTSPTWSTYTLAVPDGWTGCLVASFAPGGNYLVNVPAYHAVTNAAGAYVKDFTLQVGTVENLSGTVTASGGGGVSNVLVYASSGSGGGGLTSADGSYVFGVVAVGPPPNKWSGIVTPQKDGFTFAPAQATYVSKTTPISGCNFVATASGGGDTQAPTWPQGAVLSATNLTSSGCSLFWTAAQDGVGVVGYRLYRSAETSVYATVVGTTNTALSSLSSRTLYTFAVQAYDAAGNASTNGPSVQFTTAAALSATNKIAFTRYVGPGVWNLWTMNRDGTGQAVLLNTSTEDRMPRFSADGSKIAFTRNTGGTGDVYTVSAEGGDLTNLTADLPNSAFSGRFSWNGSQLCFDYCAGTTNHDIYVMNSDGTGKRAVVSNPLGDDTTPAFSPDSQWLVFQRKTVWSDTDPRSVICKVRTNGNDFAVLTDNSELDEMPVFTSDGTHILFKRGGRSAGPAGQIYRMDVNGGSLTNLTNNGVQNDSPAVSPEGDLYAFMSISGGDMEIFTMNTDGSGQTQLTDNSVADFDPSFSPASGGGGGSSTLPPVATNRLVVSRHTTQPWFAKLVLMDTSGSNEVDLTEGTIYGDGIPHFNPQGTKIVFVRNLKSGMSTTGDITVIQADGKGLTNLTSDVADSCNAPHWSWDGARITYDRRTVSGTAINHDIYVMDADGKNKTLVLGGAMSGQADDSSPFFSPDGRWIVFQRMIAMGDVTNRTEIWKVEIATGRTVQLTQKDTALGTSDQVDETPTWSADGKAVLFKRGLSPNPTDLWAVNAEDGSNLRQMTTAGLPVGYGYYAYEGDCIFYQTYVGTTSETTSEIYRMNTDGSGAVRITDNSGSDIDASPSPRSGGALPVAPVIAVSTNRLSPECTVGQTAAAAELVVRNAGGGTLTYAVGTNAAWVSVSPINGTCLREHDVLSVAYDTDGLSAGDYAAAVTVAAAGATNSPCEVAISLHVKETWEDGFNAWARNKGLPAGAEGPSDDPDHDGFVTLSEYIADTQPASSNSFLRIAGISLGPPVSVLFEPSSTGRVYTLQANTNGLGAGDWFDVGGQTRLPGLGGTDLLEDEHGAGAIFYRVKVELP